MDLWNLVEAFLGSFFGAGFAFLTAHITRRRDEASKEKAVLNGLLVDLSLKRSLVINEPKLVDPKERAHDIERCGQSVLDCRRLIRETRVNLTPRSAAFKALESMAGACNAYLHESRLDPSNYEYLFGDLQSKLDVKAKELDGMKGVYYRRPGGAAYG